MVMKTLIKIYSVIIVLLPFAGHPFLLGHAAAEPLKVTGGVVHNEIISPVSIPEKIHLNLLFFSLVIIDQQGIIGGVAVYDDPTTDRNLDYCELYDEYGELVGVGWLDEFGIERTALDSGFLQGADKLERVFVIVIDGDLV